MNSSDKEKLLGSTCQASTHVPELARVPKPAARGELLGDESLLKTTRSARAHAKTRLRDMGRRIRSGNDTGLEALIRAGFGKTTRGLAGCEHYLPTNRFEWWDIDRQGLVPQTGPIGVTGTSATLDVDVIFYSEFCSPLSTVVGAVCTLLSRSEPGVT